MTGPSDFSAVIAHLQAEAMSQAEPATDLWPRIVTARSLQLRRQRRVRYVSGVLAAGIACVATLVGLQPRLSTSRSEDAIDWQARAQVLELQLAAMDHGHGMAASMDAADVEAELGDIDRRLQTAYERNGPDAAKYTNELAPLWKRRSELLNTLILARRQGLALTRI